METGRNICGSESGSARQAIDLEICVDDVEGMFAAQSAHVARIELCAALPLGGLTPSAGLIAAARGSKVPVFVMIRPRSGDFVFSPSEEAQMIYDIRVVREAGLAGVVLGAMTRERSLDIPMLQRLSAACGPLRRQLHRVIDLLDDPIEALEQAIALGFERILTSGQAVRAGDGVMGLKALHNQARGRIAIMAGSGVRPENLAEIKRLSGVNSFHASCREAIAVQDERLDHFGFAAEQTATSAAAILRLHEAIRSASRSEPH